MINHFTILCYFGKKKKAGNLITSNFSLIFCFGASFSFKYVLMNKVDISILQEFCSLFL